MSLSQTQPRYPPTRVSRWPAIYLNVPVPGSEAVTLYISVLLYIYLFLFLLNFVLRVACGLKFSVNLAKPQGQKLPDLGGSTYTYIESLDLCIWMLNNLRLLPSSCTASRLATLSPLLYKNLWGKPLISSLIIKCIMPVFYDQ